MLGGTILVGRLGVDASYPPGLGGRVASHYYYYYYYYCYYYYYYY